MSDSSSCVQLAEAQQQFEAEHRCRSAAESALEAQSRERRAAEYARSRPTSPHKDAALQSELADLRLQVRQLTLAITPEIGLHFALHTKYRHDLHAS